MKKFLSGVVVGFMVSCAVAFAATDANHNGDFWKHLTHSAKSGYVNGYSDAMTVSVAKLDELNVAADMFHWKGARKIIRQLSKQLSMNELTPEQAVQRLDELYSNQKYSELDLGSAIQALTIRASETATPELPAKSPK
ncbi:MAG TPA: hypothetical protein VMU16_15270 [Candidatus Binataceae bacterium]|nr:hypothetical protein [Candidatus Binataceae bacterium]